jgi:hypothetical protein
VPIAWMIIIIGDGGVCDSGVGGEAHLQRNSNADACPAKQSAADGGPDEDDDTASIATQLKNRSPIKLKTKDIGIQASYMI